MFDEWINNESHNILRSLGIKNKELFSSNDFFGFNTKEAIKK